MLIFSNVWVLFILAPLPPFHYFKVVLNSDSGLTPPSFSANFIISTVYFFGTLPLGGFYFMNSEIEWPRRMLSFQNEHRCKVHKSYQNMYEAVSTPMTASGCSVG